MSRHSAQCCDPMAGAPGEALPPALPPSSCETLHLLQLWLLYRFLSLSLSPGAKDGAEVSDLDTKLGLINTGSKFSRMRSP